MDNWILKGAKNLVNEKVSVNITSPTQVKVKVTYLMLTDYDSFMFDGAIQTTYPKILGRAAVGVVIEAGEKCYGLQQGTRVYLEPTRACGECLPCKTGKNKDCTSVLAVGKDFDGFMRDFVVCEYNEVSPIPDAVDDFHALCIETVGIAENIYDKLNLSAGQRVAIVGADFTGNIMAQVLLYHKVIPVIIDNNPENLERAKKCGIHYAYAADDDLLSNVMSATSGNLCDAAIYCASSRLPLSLSTRLVRNGAIVVLNSNASINLSIDTSGVLEKNLTVLGVSNAYGYTDAVMNMFIHNAVNIDCFKKEILTEYNPAELLSNKLFKSSKLTIFKMII